MLKLRRTINLFNSFIHCSYYEYKYVITVSGVFLSTMSKTPFCFCVNLELSFKDCQICLSDNSNIFYNKNCRIRPDNNRITRFVIPYFSGYSSFVFNAIYKNVFVSFYNKVIQYTANNIIKIINRFSIR